MGVSTLATNFNYVSSFIPLQFQLNTSGLSNINYGGYNAEVVSTGSGNPQISGITWPFGTASSNLRSDIWLTQSGLASPKVTFWTFVHETGHALGLRDGSAVGFDGTAGYGVITQQFSVMSYWEFNQSSFAAVESGISGAIRVAEYQLYDVSALQYLHGRDIAESSGSNSYVYSSTSTGNSDFVETNAVSGGTARARRRTIVDYGGTDIISAAGSNFPAYIDLRPAHFSSIGPAAGVIISDTGSLTNIGIQNASIAFGTYIENATGSSANDLLIGNLLSNELSGGAGNDVLLAEGRSVFSYQGIFSFTLDTDDGDYSVIDKDSITSKIFDPQAQADILFGESGNDLLYGGRGKDILDGGADNDQLYGDDGNDTLLGGNGIDYLVGGSDNDRLVGGLGDDRYSDNGTPGDTSDDIKGGLYGGDGDDLLIVELNDGDDVLNGGSPGILGNTLDGTDTVVYKYDTGDSTILITGESKNKGQKPNEFGLSIGLSGGGDFGNDTLVSIEKAAVEAGSGKDTLIINGDTRFIKLNYIDLGGQASSTALALCDVLDAKLATTNITVDLRDASNQKLKLR